MAAKKIAKLIAANKNKDHKIKETEVDLVHALIWRKEFSRDTGKPLFKPYSQIFNPKEWYNFLEHPGGLSVKEVLHLPDGVKNHEQYFKEKKERMDKINAKLAGKPVDK